MQGYGQLRGGAAWLDVSGRGTLGAKTGHEKLRLALCRLQDCWQNFSNSEVEPVE